MSLRQFWDQHVLIPNNRYRKVVKLRAHYGAINCFAVSGGDLLASGGDDQKVHIWNLNLENSIPRQTLQDRHGRWGQITTMLGIDDSIVACPILVFGTGRGALLIYKRPLKQLDFYEACLVHVFDHIDSVESVAYDGNSNHLAIASHSAKLILFRLQRDGALSRVWKNDLTEASLPRMLNFVDQGSRLIVHSLERGKMLYIDVETGTGLPSKRLRTPVGHGDMCLSTKTFVVDNMTTGFDLYDFRHASPIRSYEVPVSRKRVKMVKFGEGSMTVIGGSDHGMVYVFNTRTSELLQVLVHQATFIQTVLTHSTLNEHVIVSGTCDDNKPGEIYIWKKPVRDFDKFLSFHYVDPRY
ncbi:hypothetical protein CVT24_013126 [Panaeolus cyanescens]|uniref:Uncharacterized protein n=1 Tax=Panaeolus cyanescens TaxID=181874 RepID=A0A409X2E2_9AGAR|nr:hypothetical protein CVT24_013126 [Panaeolus cyanescens]